MRTITSRVEGIVAEIAAAALLVVVVLLGIGVLSIINAIWGSK